MPIKQKHIYLFSHENAMLDDPSVGRNFVDTRASPNIFKAIIGYQTQTELKKLDFNGEEAHLDVQFTGDFPEGRNGYI